MPHHQNIIKAIMDNDAKTLHQILISLKLSKEDINALDDNLNSYFHIAAKRLLRGDSPSDFYLLQLLLEYGIDPTLLNKEGKQALELGDVNTLDYENHWTPLLTAVHRALPDLFNLLIHCKAVDLNKSSQDGLSPVAAAAFNRPNPEMLDALIKAGADIFIGYGKGQLNPLHMAFSEYNDNLRDKEFYDNLLACINILLENYAGIGFSFYAYKEATTKFNFTDKLVFGCNIDDRYKKLNSTIELAIRTIDQWERKLSEKNLNKAEEYEKVRNVCLKIARACNNTDQEMFQRVNNVLEELNKKSPTTRLAPPVTKPDNSDKDKDNGKDEDKSLKPKEKARFVDSVLGLFKSSSSPKSSSKDTVPTSNSTSHKPNRQL